MTPVKNKVREKVRRDAIAQVREQVELFMWGSYPRVPGLSVVGLLIKAQVTGEIVHEHIQHSS